MSYVRMSDLAQYEIPYSGEDLQRVLRLGQKPGCPIMDEAGNITWVTGTSAPGAIMTRWRRQPLDEATSARLEVATVTLKARVTRMKALRDQAVNALNAFVLGGTEDEDSVSFTAGLVAARDMGDLRYGVYADAAEFVIYAPDRMAAGQLCQQKIDIEAAYSELWNGNRTSGAPGVADLLQKAGAAAQNRALRQSIKAWFVGWKNAIFAVIQRFIDLVQSLFDLILKVFSFSAGFLMKYPNALLWGAAGVAGVGALAGAGYLWFKYRQVKSK